MLVALALLFNAALAANAPAQSEPQLAGPVRDIARTEILYPALLDPLVELPLTPNLQASVEARGTDLMGIVHAGVRTGDVSYNVIASGPLRHRDTTRFLDRRRIPVASFGFDVTNIIWRPKARPSLIRQLGTTGFLTSPSGRPLDPPVHGTAPAELSRESEQAVARAIDTTDAVDLPWAIFLNGGYQFGSKDYAYTDLRSLEAVSASHLSDVAHMLVGAQFRVRLNDPGYFVAFSFNYSSLFHDAAMKLGPPTRLFGTLLRLDVRRPLATRHVGINPTLTYELDTRVTTVEAATYWWFAPDDRAQTRNSTKLTAGVRVGYQRGRGGLFASVFAGPVFAAR